jgi:ElaB/YqjD/DUF883 family membrane-anchored ribosome-binding protein
MDIRIDETAAEPQTVDEARDAVERSRQRISSTLDQLEGRIVEKKHELQDRADVLRPVRERIAERPFTAVVVAAGVGALLGSLGGGDGDEDRSKHRHARSGRVRGEMSDSDRRELREWRKARKERLRSTLDRHRDDSSRDSESGSRFDGLKHQLMGAVTAAITTAVTKRVRSLAMDNIGNLLGGDESRHDRGRHAQDRGFGEDRPDYDRPDVRY